MNSSLNGKVALITGGTDGIGKETALGLAKLGVELVLVGRNEQRGQSAVNYIKTKVPAAKVEYLQADLSLMSEVTRLASTFKTMYSHLEFLIHSAAVINTKRLITAENLEATFATDYLSRFLLTNLLLDTLKASAPARIVNIAASGMNFGTIKFAELYPEPKISGFRALAQAQLANDVFTIELGQRLEATGVTVVAMHPGAVDTNVRQNFPRLVNLLLGFVMKPFALTPQQGAEAPLLLATAPQFLQVNGGLFKRLRQIPPSLKVSDPALRRKLWDFSSRVSGFKVEVREAVTSS